MTTWRQLGGSMVVLALSTACKGSKPPETTAPAAPAASTEEPAAPALTPATPSAPTGASATAPTDRGETLFVDDKRVECQGEAPMQCLRVRKSAGDEWELFYESIEGFEYEEGYHYELRVEVSPVKNPPADEGSLEYRLLEVISKEPSGGGK